MLNELLKDYKRALIEGNKKEQKYILKVLAQVGMDKMTVDAIIDEIELED